MGYQPGLGAPPPKVKRGRGCCLGCAIPVVLIVALAVGGFFLLTSAASAATAVPAQLLIVTPAASVTHGGTSAVAKSGSLIREGDSVKTDAKGRAVVQFQDGSLTRIAPGSEIKLDSTKFGKNGALQNVTITQVAGRTLSTVEHLVTGAKFHVGGHNASAEVRGTRWEFVITKDGKTVLKVYVGTVKLGAGGKEIDVIANKQVTVEADGKVGAVITLVNEPGDPFTLWVAADDAAAKNGSTPGTAAYTHSTAPVSTGQTQVVPDYGSAGGDLVGDLIYPGSNMQLQITDPNGKVFSAAGGVAVPGVGRLVEIVIPNGPPGIYKVKVNPLDVPAPGEEFSVTLTTKIACQTGIIDGGGQVRHIYAASDIVSVLAQSGATDAAVTFGKVSSGGASISVTANFAGTQVSAQALVYAAGSGLGAVLGNVKVAGVDLTGQVLSAIASAGGKNLDSLELGFSVDRVYTCSNGKDTAMVVEGHR